MKTFTGFEYLLIDVANNTNLGLDKKTFEERLQWVEENLDGLELLAAGEQWKERPMYIKAVQAVRKSQRGEPTGHLVGFDAVCSGMQIMSALTGCEDGANATGLIDPTRRADAYSDCTDFMVQELGHHIPGERDKVKQAVMTSLYGSKAEPEKEFGKDSPELEAFYKAMYKLCPGACDLLTELLDSWQPYALQHEWRLPDGFLARVKVMQKTTQRIEVDELDHTTFTYEYHENEGEEKGVKNAANVVHSIDAYVLRSLIRRCTYDHQQAYYAEVCVSSCLLERSMMTTQDIYETMCVIGDPEPELKYYIEQFERSGVPDIVILPHLWQNSVWHLSDAHLRALKGILETMLKHRPFEIVTVHDDFKCHPNYMNHLRTHYRDILAELAESQLIGDILGQIHGMPGTYHKRSHTLGAKIRQSNYALC